MEVLHVTAWYPTKKAPKAAFWVKEHIRALASQDVQNKVYHVEACIGDWEWSLGKDELFGNKKFRIVIPKAPWFLLEVLSGVLIAWVLFKERKNYYNLINFHIAYPNLTYWHWIKRWVKTPVVITEHWSAYHFNFGVKRQLPRIQKIFRQNIPVITVSEALAKDIKLFSQTGFQHYVVPNVVDDKVFYMERNQERKPFLFMVSQWKTPKTPILVMKAFLKSEISLKYTLKVGGFGPLWSDMESFVNNNNAASKIELQGLLDSQQIADYMRQCTAFLHPSEYETFSVVCAEATACGAYVIAPNIGGIPEAVGNNGSLIQENKLASWIRLFENLPEKFMSSYDKNFSSENIGNTYQHVLKKVAEQFEIKK